MKSRRKSTRGTMTRIRRKGRAGAAVIKKKQRVRDAALVLSMFVFISLFCVWSRVAVLQTGYRLHNLVRQYHKAEDNYRTLRLELATLKSPRRLVPLAKKQLNLQQPTPNQVVIVPESIRIAEQSR